MHATDPLRMLKSLAYQLATNVPEMRATYTSMNSESVSKISRLEEAFLELLLQPIQVRQKAVLLSRFQTKSYIHSDICSLMDRAGLQEYLEGSQAPGGPNDNRVNSQKSRDAR